MKPHEAVKCTAAIVAAYPKPAMTEERMELYCRMLLDLDGPKTMKAIERLFCTKTWQPSIAEIREEVNRGESTRPDPEIAWGEVVKAISRYGMNRNPEFSCPELAAAVDVMGWRNICTDENTSSTRARFIDAYRSIHTSSTRREVLGPHGGGTTALPARGGAKMLGEVIKKNSEGIGE